jgi:radical SAM protein (TIGR01212 family)
MSAADPMPAGLSPGQRYRSFGRFLRERFGVRVQRVTLDGGFTCPNVDGRVAVGGCVFCDNRSFSPNRRLPRASLRAQLERGVAILGRRYGVERFLAYFQAATNTYAPVEKLRRLYDEALAHPQVVGLAIGTRPDCVPEPVLDLIADYARERYVCLELGLQSRHDRSLEWMNRGHDFAAFVDAVQRCRGRGFDVCAHVILNLPGESRDDMLATADALAALPVQAVKVHNLHVVRNTPLERMYADGAVRLFERDEYVGVVCDFLEHLPPDMVVQRLSGDAPPDYLVAPAWCLDKPALLRAIHAELERRDSWLGKHLRRPPVELPDPRPGGPRVGLPVVGV